MNILESFSLAMKSILSSKARSLLTMLGIIIGVGAVIVIVGLGNGMEIYMTDMFKSMGTNLLTVTVTGRNSSRSVSVDDMYDIADKYPKMFDNVSPTVQVRATVKIGSETLDSTSITGVSEAYAEMRTYTLDGGRFIEYVDTLKHSKVCVVGSFIAKEYYNGNPIGKTIKLNGTEYLIVGMLTENAESEEGDADDALYLPYSTAAKLGWTTINSFSLSMVSEDDAAMAKAIVTAELTEIFGSEDAFNVFSMAEMLDMMTTMVNVMITILTAIAAISLVVGGIGIMNIMLVSVSERTREIGIRKALGAKGRNILTQFVIEAGTTSAIGGIIGIILGYALSSLGTTIIVAALEADMTIAPSTTAVLGAFAISAGIGILFGYLPAQKAANLLPIDALRYD